MATNLFENVEFEQPGNMFDGVTFDGWGEKPEPWWKARLKEAGTRQLEDLDLILGGVGATMAWPVSKIAGAGQILVDKLTSPEMPATIGRERAEQVEQDVASWFYTPQTQYGQETLQNLFSPIEAGLDVIHKAANIKPGYYDWAELEPLDKSHPRLAYMAEIATDLMAFKGAHTAGAKTGKVLADKMAALQKNRGMTAEEALAIVKAEFEQSPEYAKLRNELDAELQTKLNVKKLREDEFDTIVSELARVSDPDGLEGLTPAQEYAKRIQRGQHEYKAARDSRDGAEYRAEIERTARMQEEKLQGDINSFVDRLVAGEKLEKSADLQFYRNNSKAIEAEINRRLEAAKTETTKAEAPPAKAEVPPAEKSLYPENGHRKVVEEEIGLEAEQAAQVGKTLKKDIKYKAFNPDDGLHYYDMGPDTFTVAGTPTIRKIRKAAEAVMEMQKERARTQKLKHPAATKLKEIEKSGKEISFDEFSKLVKEADAEAGATREKVYTSVEEAINDIKALLPDVKRWLDDSNSGIDIGSLEGKVREIAGDFEPRNPAHSEVIDGAERLLLRIEETKAKRAVEVEEVAPPSFEGLQKLRDQMFEQTKGEWNNFIDDLRLKTSLENLYETTKEEIGIKGKKSAELTDAEATLLDEKFTNKIKEAYQGLEGTSYVHRSIEEIARDIKDLLFDDLKSERGSISFKKGDPKRQQALKRLVRDAERLGRDLAEYLRDLGLSTDAIKAIQKEVGKPDEKGPKDSFVREMTSDPGKRVGRKSRKAKDPETGEIYEVEFPAIYEKELEVVKNLKDVNFTLVETRPFDVLGKEAKDLFLRPLRRAEHLIATELNEFRKWSKDLRKTVSHRSKRRIGIYATAQQIGGVKTLEAMGIKEIPKLTPQEMKVYKAFRDHLEIIYDRINHMRIKNGLNKFRHVDNYFTFFQDMVALEKMGISTAQMRASTFKRLTGAFFKFAQPRGKKPRPIELDAFRVMELYERASLKHIHQTPVSVKLRRLLKEFEERGSDGKIHKFGLSRKAPNTYEFVSKWLDDVVRGRPAPTEPRFDRAVSFFNRSLVGAVLSGNLRSALIQASATRNSFIMHPIRTLEAIPMTMRPKYFKRAGLKSEVLTAREFDYHVAELADLVYEGKISVAKEKGIQAGLFLLRALDSVTARVTWNAAYESALKDLKLAEREAIRYADDIVVNTQGSGSILDLSPLQRQTAFRLFTTFQTFAINEFNFILKDILGYQMEGMSNATKIKRALLLVAGTTAINSFYEDVLGVDSPYPTPLRAFRDATDQGKDWDTAAWKGVKEVMEVFPIFGGAIRYSQPGRPSHLGAIPGTITDFIENPDVTRVAKKMWRGEEIKANDIKAVENVAKLVGVPYTAQISKTLRRYMAGERELWKLLVGKYDPPPKKKKIKNY